MNNPKVEEIYGESLTASVGTPSQSAEEQNPAAEENSFAEILSQYEQEHTGRDQTIQGTVVSVTPDAVFVDVGRKMDGVLPAGAVRGRSGEVTLKPGDTVNVTISGRDEEGNYRLSTIKVEQPKDWSGLERAFAAQAVISGSVTELVKGGLRVDVGIPAFMPASRSGARDIPEMEKLVGQEIQCKVIKLDTAKEDVVVDRRAVLEQQAKEAKERAFGELKEGAVVRGVVRSLTDFGAFVDIGGIDGLLHVADISWSRIAKPSDALKAGDEIEVKILKINPATRRISLGMKQLAPDPWTQAAARFHPGDRVQGKVSRLTDFGAFVELLPGVDGLIHISEMSWSKKVRKPSDVLQPGETVEVVVLGVNPGEKRISLGLKQALGDPWEEAEKKYAPGAVVEGTVTSIQNFGAFVDLGNGIEGMIHVADITREKRLNHAREALQQGQTVRAQVLEVDRARRRIRLGMKQLEPTSLDHYLGEHQEGEVVTGRVMHIGNGKAKIELGEGVTAECRLPGPNSPVPAEANSGGQSKADISSLTAMLQARWKQGGTNPAAPKTPAIRPGELRTFRISRLDAANKKIDLELAS